MIDGWRSRGALPLSREEQKRTCHRRMRLVVVQLWAHRAKDEWQLR
jgi:hypothetical protein